MYETFFIVYHFWLVMLHLFRDQDLLSRLSPLAYPASTTRIAFPATVWAANGVSKRSYSLLPLNSKLRRTKKPPARVGQTSKHHCWRNSILYITVGENRGYSNSWRDGRLQSISLRAQKDRFYSFFISAAINPFFLDATQLYEWRMWSRFSNWLLPRLFGSYFYFYFTEVRGSRICIEIHLT